MSVHEAKVQWKQQPHSTEPSTYSRNHWVTLNGDQQLNVSASTEFKGDAHCADPEQMLISAVSSCHMLFFLAIAEFQGYTVESYDYNPRGYLKNGDKGSMSITRIVLSPKITFSGEKQPDTAAIAKIHQGAHKNCFIRNSVTASVEISQD